MTWLHAVIDVPASDHARAAEFWGRTLGWGAGDPWRGHPELRSFVPPQGTPYVHLQEIDGPPRVHLDLESEDPVATAGRAVDLGATHVADHDRWHTFTSPGGLPFCVLAVADHEPPEPVTWPGGHRSRMVQACVDSPVTAHERKVAFWRALLPGRWVDSAAPEFAGTWHDDAGSPLQLLFQRLDEHDGPVRLHLDQGTDVLEAEVRRLRDLDADDIGPGRGWHTLRDPPGPTRTGVLRHRELTGADDTSRDRLATRRHPATPTPRVTPAATGCQRPPVPAILPRPAAVVVPDGIISRNCCDGDPAPSGIRGSC